MNAVPKVGEVVNDIPPDGRGRHSKGGARSKHQPLMDAAGGAWVVLYVGRAAAGVQSAIGTRNWFREGGYEVKYRTTGTPGVAVIYGRSVQ